MTTPDSKAANPQQNPILNDPHKYPEWHWQIDSHMKAYAPAMPGRRPSQDIPIAPKGKATNELILNQFGVQFPKLELVNEIRDAVHQWRESGYPRTTSVTRELLNHWNPENRDDEDRKAIYFAQWDALLTHVYLHEVRPENITERIRTINVEHNDGVPRTAHKMATGTGKTLVMAMLVTWQTANHIERPGDERFTSNFLFLTPGNTVTERLQAALQPNSPRNEYDEFELLPPGNGWKASLNQARITVANRHALEPRDLYAKVPQLARQVLGPHARNPSGTETLTQAVDRVLKDMNFKEKVMVINDEGHHCHKGEASKRENDETKWFNGLKAIWECGRMLYATDMSATPIHIGQRGKPLFHWIVSDYSLLDAIEAGLVKIPRVPTVRDDVEFSEMRNLYGSTENRERLNFTEDPKNNTLLKSGLWSAYRNYLKTRKNWQRQRIDDKRAEAPAMAIVMNTVKNADRLFQWIATGRSGMSELSNQNANGQAYQRPRTIVVHSNLDDPKSNEINAHIQELAETYRRAYRIQLAGKTDNEVIRAVMNTVGRSGEPGEAVRCVISVNMLTEGWDARNITHLVGFRAFQSALLCEQVAGRTLRRSHHTKGEDEKFLAEYAEIIGIPFPQSTPEEPCPRCRQKQCQCPPPPTVSIMPLNEQAGYMVDWPNITGVSKKVSDDGAATTITVQEHPNSHTVPSYHSKSAAHLLEPITGISHTLGQHRGEPVSATRYLYVTAAKAVGEIRKRNPEPGESNSNHTADRAGMFTELLIALKQFKSDGILRGPEEDQWAGTEHDWNQTVEWLLSNVHIADNTVQGTARTELERDPSSPILSSGSLQPYKTAYDTAKIYGPTTKSHVNYAHCDSGWETEVARQLDQHPAVTKWVRNHRLHWRLPYYADGQQKRYAPDFVAVTTLPDSGELHVIIEVKGRERLYDAEKQVWARDIIIPALNRELAESGRQYAYLYLNDQDKCKEAGNAVAELANEVSN